MRNSRLCFAIMCALFIVPCGWSQTTGSATESSIPYLQLTAPRHVMPDAQPWEGKEFPHTFSVLELNRDGYRYWG
ncbi:MAG TPA: hypothetical protein VFF50_13355, partial [Candidatus Deferrimicrobiaceae bacterium]|nr:hypothetical protein [Candidatus Deferrimicrobiaceae bacterium]